LLLCTLLCAIRDVTNNVLLLMLHFLLLFQGGANAGHTIYDENGTKYALHLLPSGVLNKCVWLLQLTVLLTSCQLWAAVGVGSLWWKGAACANAEAAASMLIGSSCALCQLPSGVLNKCVAN
jgi:hypothetical protein